MKQKHINNAVVYLGRSIYFFALLGFFILMNDTLMPRYFFYIMFIFFPLVIIIILSIVWSLIKFLDEVGKAVSKQ